MKNKSIGVIDSGVGGLTVLNQLKRVLKNENFIYFADTERMPYGVKTKDEIIKFSLEITDFLLTKDIKLLVLACNTITSNAILEIENYIDIPVIGVIEPGVQMAINTSKNNNIGILATAGTINSNVYQDMLRLSLGNCEVKGVPGPKLVEIAERGIDGFGKDQALEEIKNALENFKDFPMDTLILGCTHFPILADYIRNILGPVHLVDPAVETANQARNVLYKMDNLKSKDSPSNTKYYITSDKYNFKAIGEKILKEKIDNLNIVKI